MGQLVIPGLERPSPYAAPGDQLRRYKAEAKDEKDARWHGSRPSEVELMRRSKC